MPTLSSGCLATGDLSEFLAQVIDSPLKLDLLTYFHRNPYTVDYAQGTAQRLKSPLRLTEEALNHLAEKGVVNKWESRFQGSRPAVYSLRRDEEVWVLVDQVANLMATREGRAWMWAHLARNRGRGATHRPTKPTSWSHILRLDPRVQGSIVGRMGRPKVPAGALYPSSAAA
jgi:hypothetical protein